MSKLKKYTEKEMIDFARLFTSASRKYMEKRLRDWTKSKSFVRVKCGNCDGEGEIEDNGPKACTMCGGNGDVEIQTE